MITMVGSNRLVYLVLMLQIIHVRMQRFCIRLVQQSSWCESVMDWLALIAERTYPRRLNRDGRVEGRSVHAHAAVAPATFHRRPHGESARSALRPMPLAWCAIAITAASVPIDTAVSGRARRECVSSGCEACGSEGVGCRLVQLGHPTVDAPNRYRNSELF
jgi:hypothetical protein